MNVVAYDYDRQAWVEGGHALMLRRDQLRETLAILRGPRAAEYLKFVGDTRTLDMAIAEKERELVDVLREMDSPSVDRPLCDCGAEGMWRGDTAGHRTFLCPACWTFKAGV